MVRCRRITTAINHSTVLSDRLREIQIDMSAKKQFKLGELNEPLRVIADVKTRWNSTYLMAERLFHLYGPIKRLFNEKNHERFKPYLLKADELDLLKDSIEVSKLLLVFRWLFDISKLDLPPLILRS